MKNIWYPGAARASMEWISYLQKTFPGKWLFSDNLPISEWNWQNLKEGMKRIQFDTLDTLPKDVIETPFNVLIISSHPGLKDFKEIHKSGILKHFQPQSIIFDPGSPAIGNIQSHLKEAPLFNQLGYSLDRIVVLPYLNHQYCEFNLST
jgi:hypothetical protein